jgi:hypothetical protein
VSLSNHMGPMTYCRSEKLGRLVRKPSLTASSSTLSVSKTSAALTDLFARLEETASAPDGCVALFIMTIHCIKESKAHCLCVYT